MRPGEPFISCSMTLITVSSSVCAERPGKTAEAMIEGGATVGYCAIGNCLIATPPMTRMKSAITHAKIGRSMKNCAIAFPYWLADLAGAVADALLPAGAAALAATAEAGGCHGTGFTGA